MSSLLVIGGARSGKSRYAESLAKGERVYVATAQAWDDEMKARIAQHQEQRGMGWKTIEAPLDLVSVLQAEDKARRFILVDCLTLWISNLMHHEADIAREIDALCNCMGKLKARVVLVSNEVGQGIVPDNAMARAFRDWQGLCNQRIASVADEVTMVVAGIPVPVKKPRRGQGTARRARSVSGRRA